jgi:O-antigen ligase
MLIPPLIAVSVVLTAFGSSTILWLRDPSYWLRFAALGVLGGVAALVLVRRPRERARAFTTPYHLGWLVLGALAVASTLWSAIPSISFDRGLSFVLLGAGAVGAVTVAGSTPEGARRVVNAVLVGILAVLAVTLLYVAIEPREAFQEAFATAEGESAARFRGIGENPNTVASYGFIVLPLLLWKIATVEGRARLAWVTAAVAASVLVGMTLTRTVLAIMVLQLVAFVLVLGTRRVRTFVLAAVALALVAGAIASVVSDEFGERVARMQNVATASGRTEAWKGAVELISERPVGGWGFGIETDIFRVYRETHLERFQRADFPSDSVHNSYLSFALQLGIAGGLLATALVLSPLLLLARRRTWAPLGPALTLAVALAAAGVTLDAIFLSYLHSAGNVIAASSWALLTLVWAPAMKRPRS